MRYASLLTLVISAAVLTQTQDTAPSPQSLADTLQRKYATIRDFSADFTHTYEGGVLRRKTTERGKVYVKKPGMMRWEYVSPEEKLFVSDGVKIYSYLPADRQVFIGTVPAGDQATTPVLFLVGKGHLTRDFIVSEADLPDLAPNTYALELIPRRREPEYEVLTLVVDRKTLQLRRLSAVDHQGGTSTFHFSNLQENIQLSDKLFRFSIPQGVDIIK